MENSNKYGVLSCDEQTIVQSVPLGIDSSFKLKHVYYFSFYGLISPSARYRAKYVLEHLHARYNITYSLVIPGYGLINILSFIKIYCIVLFFRRKKSLIIFQKIYTNGIYAALLKLLLALRNHNTVYDIDDAEYLRFSDKSIKYFLRKCTSAYVGSYELLNYTSQYNKNSFLLTSPVTNSDEIRTKRNHLFTVGWLGDYGTGKEISKDYSHKTSLNQLFFPAIKGLDVPLKIIIIGVHSNEDREEIFNYFSSKKNILVEIPQNINWLDEKSIHEFIVQFDIGVSPMVDHEFNRAKSAFKLKQYFSCGIPALASPVGENNKFLKDGENGFFCKSAKDFKEKILSFYFMNDLDYARFSKNAMNSISNCDLDNFCKLILTCCED